MTISTETRRAGPYAGNGSTTAFAFAFKVFSTSQVLVTRAVIATGAETTLTLTSDYTVTLNADQNANPGGTVTMVTAPTTAQSITITSNVANLQPTAVANLGTFYPDVINDGLDRATMQIQQLDERVDRALVIPVSSSGVSTQLPAPQSSALIGWDAGATALQNYNSTPVGSTVYQYLHRVVASAGQTVFTLPVAYVINASAITVFVNGLRLEQGAGLDWVETNTTTVTFTSGLASGDLVTFVVNILASVVPIAAFPAASVSAFGATLVDDANDAAARTTLGIDADTTPYLSSFAGSTLTTVADFLDRIISLDNGAVAHTDGSGNTITGSPRWFIGNNAPSIDDSALLIGRGLTGSYVSGAHALRDETIQNSTGAGLHAYASIDSIPKQIGSTNYNHLRSFQSRPEFAGSGTNDEVAGYTFQMTHNGTGIVDIVRGVVISDALGTGPINNQYGIWFDDLTRGTSSNFAIYSGSTSLPSYHGGKWQVGTAPQIDVAGFKTAYGGLLSVDTAGEILPNPNLTIVNGVLTMANSTTSRVDSSVAFRLELQAVGIVESKKPLQLPVYTVATLPSPAATYAYCRAFVSDSNATTFAAIVAGGGSDKVPVYSDGTNWRIG